MEFWQVTQRMLPLRDTPDLRAATAANAPVQTAANLLGPPRRSSSSRSSPLYEVPPAGARLVGLVGTSFLIYNFSGLGQGVPTAGCTRTLTGVKGPGTLTLTRANPTLTLVSPIFPFFSGVSSYVP